MAQLAPHLGNTRELADGSNSKAWNAPEEDRHHATWPRNAPAANLISVTEGWRRYDTLLIRPHRILVSISLGEPFNSLARVVPA